MLSRNIRMLEASELSENRSKENKNASAGNRTRVTSMATMYSATRPLMLLCVFKEHWILNYALGWGPHMCGKPVIRNAGGQLAWRMRPQWPCYRVYLAPSRFIGTSPRCSCMACRVRRFTPHGPVVPHPPLQPKVLGSIPGAPDVGARMTSGE